MEIRRLRHFLAVVDSGSFSAAAVACHLSQQGLSKSIATLEQNIGTPLLNRDTRHVTLTRYGDLLVPVARNIIAEVQQYQRQVDDLTGLDSGRVVVGAGRTAASYLLPAVVSNVALERPRLSISVVDGTTSELLPKLLVGDLDISICVLTELIDDPRLIQQTILQEKLSIIVGSNHPLSKRPKVSLEELTRHPWLSWGAPELAGSVAGLFQQAGLAVPTPKIVTTSMAFGISLLVNNDFISAFSEHAVSREIEVGVLSSINLDVDVGDLGGPMVLCYRKKSTPSRETSFFIQQLIKVAAGFQERVDQ